MQEWYARKPGYARENYRVSWEGVLETVQQFDKIMWEVVHDFPDQRPVLRLEGEFRAQMEDMYYAIRMTYIGMSNYINKWGINLTKVTYLMALTHKQWRDLCRV